MAGSYLFLKRRKILEYTNITVNGLKMPISKNSTIEDLLEKFFDMRCEFIVKRNSKAVAEQVFRQCKIKENDILQVVAYSKFYYKIQKRTIFKSENTNKNLKEG